MGKYKYTKSNFQKRMVITIINFMVGYGIGIGFQKLVDSAEGTEHEFTEEEKAGVRPLAMLISYLFGFAFFRFCQRYVTPLKLEKR